MASQWNTIWICATYHSRGQRELLLYSLLALFCSNYGLINASLRSSSKRNRGRVILWAIVNRRMTIEASELTGKEKVGLMFSLELEDWMCEANTMTAEQAQLTMKL